MSNSSGMDASKQFKSQGALFKKGERFEGFDFLRAIFAIAIVAYKTKVFYIPYILFPNAFTYILSAYVLSGMFGALAVPAFLQISLFLFFLKSGQTGLDYFLKKRLPRLISLYLFWVGLITLFDIVFVDRFEAVQQAISSPKKLVEFIISGNNTPYFFFFSLIFVTVLAELFVLLLSRFDKSLFKQGISYFLLGISLTLIFFLSLIETLINTTNIQFPVLNFLNSLASWDYTPLNFLPYIFTAAITAQEYNAGFLEQLTKPLRLKLCILLFLATAFFLIEYALTESKILIQVDAGPLDHYLRLSLVFASWLLLYLALLSKRYVPASIRFVSACSLGIYGFHVFFTFKQPLPLSTIPYIGHLFTTFPILAILTNFAITLTGAILLTIIFRKSKPLKQFVSA